jgi:N-acetylneuraminate synthase
MPEVFMPPQARTFIIAEAGVNHNGSVELALELIAKAAEAGADAVKFQTFKAEKLIVPGTDKADYQKKTSGENESQYDMIKKLELDETVYPMLIECCNKHGIEFLSTPFDEDSLTFLTQTCRLTKVKFSSGDLTNAPLLLKAAQLGTPTILSTGMSTLGEVEEALEVLAFGYSRPQERPSREAFRQAYVSEEGQRALRENVTLLHCTTEYPAPFSEVNLKVLDTLRSAFGLPVGYSDHTAGIAVPIAAVALGAVVIEKHFTLDRNLPGPDHQSSLEPEELKVMVRSIREVEAAIGNSIKMPVVSEARNVFLVRKSLVAQTDIAAGEPFTERNLTTKRPGKGQSPFRYWELLGKKAARSYKENEPINE